MGIHYYPPPGPDFADLMCSMDLEPLELVPSPPRTYPTNYLVGPPWECEQWARNCGTWRGVRYDHKLDVWVPI